MTAAGAGHRFRFSRATVAAVANRLRNTLPHRRFIQNIIDSREMRCAQFHSSHRKCLFNEIAWKERSRRERAANGRENGMERTDRIDAPADGRNATLPRLAGCCSSRATAAGRGVDTHLSETYHRAPAAYSRSFLGM